MNIDLRDKYFRVGSDNKNNKFIYLIYSKQKFEQSNYKQEFFSFNQVIEQDIPFRRTRNNMLWCYYDDEFLSVDELEKVNNDLNKYKRLKKIESIL
jgi:hypothetical protein